MYGRQYPLTAPTSIIPVHNFLHMLSRISHKITTAIKITHLAITTTDEVFHTQIQILTPISRPTEKSASGNPLFVSFSHKTTHNICFKLLF